VKRIASAVLVAAALGIMVAAWGRYTRAHGDARAALALHAAVRNETRELNELRRRAGVVSLGQRPEPGLIEQVRSTLADAGVAREALASLQPGAELEAPASRPLDPVGPRYLRQTAVASIQPIRMPELGVFLDAWRRRGNGWNIDSIQIAPVRADDRTDPAPPLRVTLGLGSLYLDPRSVPAAERPEPGPEPAP
jgi:hypothetical protein